MTKNEIWLNICIALVVLLVNLYIEYIYVKDYRQKLKKLSEDELKLFQLQKRLLSKWDLLSQHTSGKITLEELIKNTKKLNEDWDRLK